MTTLCSRRLPGERGSISVWMITASFVMAVLVGLSVDLGGQVHAQQRAHHFAAQAARTGAERVQSPTAIQGHTVHVHAMTARAAAADYLRQADVDGTAHVIGGHTVRVHVTDTYTPIFLGVIGVGPRTVTGEADARIVRTLGGNEQ